MASGKKSGNKDGIDTSVDLNNDFVVSCLLGGGALNLNNEMSCSMPNGETVKPSAPLVNPHY